MNVLLDGDERAVQKAARDFLDGESPTALVREMEKDDLGYPPDLWRAMADLGWIGMSLPESYGGQGLPLHFSGILLSELGRHITPAPFHSTVVAALVLAEYGTEEQKNRLLPGVIAGESVATFAFQEPSAGISPRSIQLTGEPSREGLALSGTKSFVDNFSAADWMLVVFRKAGSYDDLFESLGVAIVERGAPGVSSVPLVTTAKDKQSKVAFEAVHVSAANVLRGAGPSGTAARYLLDLAVGLLCAQIVGATRRDMEFGVEYSKQRIAFGRPIGSFQSIKHLAADMLIATDGAELLTYEALWRLGAGLPASAEISQAKSFASKHCIAVCRSSQQIHGGIGFMLEYDLQLWYRRVAAWCLRLGSSHEHRRRIAPALLDRQGEIRLGDTLELN